MKWRRFLVVEKDPLWQRQPVGVLAEDRAQVAGLTKEEASRLRDQTQQVRDAHQRLGYLYHTTAIQSDSPD